MTKRMIAVGSNGHLVELPDGQYMLDVPGTNVVLTGDLFKDWVPTAHTILAEAEIINTERGQRP